MRKFTPFAADLFFLVFISCEGKDNRQEKAFQLVEIGNSPRYPYFLSDKFFDVLDWFFGWWEKSLFVIIGKEYTSNPFLKYSMDENLLKLVCPIEDSILSFHSRFLSLHKHTRLNIGKVNITLKSEKNDLANFLFSVILLSINLVHNHFNSKLKVDLKQLKNGVIISRLKASAFKEWLDYWNYKFNWKH